MNEQPINCYSCGTLLAQGSFTHSEVDCFWALCKGCLKENIKRNMYLTVTSQSPQLIDSKIDSNVLKNHFKEYNLL